MIQKVTLPKLGQTVESATIERWVKREGDTVRKGEVLCEITTDKATLEVESFFRGMLLKVLAPEGRELPVGALIAVIGEPGDVVPESLLTEGDEEAIATPPTVEAPEAQVKAAIASPAEDAPKPAPAQAATGPLPSGVSVMMLPKLGQTVESAKIERWLKREGDTVGKGEVLCEITTDKATLEVESFYRGTLLRVLAPEGAELPVGAAIAVIGPAGAELPEDLSAGAAPAAAPVSAPQAQAVAHLKAAVAKAADRPAGRIFASPRARMRARERGIDVAALTGSGPNGRIVEADVLAAAEASPAGAEVRATPLARRVAAAQGTDLAAVTGTGPRGKVTREDVERAARAPAAAAPPAYAGRPGQIVPLTAMRRIVAERMSESKRTIPCYYLEVEADVTDLVCLRNKLNAKASGYKITFGDFILKACGRALLQFPVVNSRWADEGVERRSEINVGFAVALDEGLIVPVVRDVAAKPLVKLSQEAADLTTRARAKKLLPEEYQGGCMTVTNLGMFGITRFIAVVNPGESCILALGAIRDQVVYRQGGNQVRKVMSLILSVDHRLVDGAVGAQFLAAIRDSLESPRTLVDPGTPGLL